MADLTVLLLVCTLHGLVRCVSGQQARERLGGPWTHRIQWENNGQVYSLLSTGSEYHAPLRSRTESRMYVSSRSDTSRHISSGSGVSGAPARRSGQAPAGAPGARGSNDSNPEYSGLGGGSGRRTTSRVDDIAPDNQRPLALTSETTRSDEDGATRDSMVSDDPRNPLKTHRNAVLYNAYPASPLPRGVPRARRPPPGTGYGTRFFHNGESCGEDR